jgi:hypothetical protein
MHTIPHAQITDNGVYLKMSIAAGPARSDEKIECIRGSTSHHITLPGEVKALF